MRAGKGGGGCHLGLLDTERIPGRFEMTRAGPPLAGPSLEIRRQRCTRTHPCFQVFLLPRRGLPYRNSILVYNERVSYFERVYIIR